MTLTEVLQSISVIYQKYVGTGMIVALFLIAVLYLIFTEKEKTKKIILVVLPLAIMALFAFPLFAWIIYRCMDEEVYYRFLWLVPVSTVISYAGVKAVLRLNGIKRVVAFAFMCVIIMLCGDYVYDNEYFSVAENPYHVPDTVAEICDEIKVEGQRVHAVFPLEMLQYVRQYEHLVFMPYGREMIVGRWNFYNEVHEVYEKGAPDGVVRADVLSDIARANSLQYIIWNNSRYMEGSLEDYGYVLKNQIDGYSIYESSQSY